LYGIGEDYLMWTGSPQSWYSATSYDGGAAVNTVAKVSYWGFNTVRLAFGNPSLRLNAHSAYDETKMNQVLDIIYASGVRAILDLHNLEPDSTSAFGSNEWVSFWRGMTQRYLNDPRVVAFEV
jgi:aryl-phospho-beta-D-glucosidase BglC (GH1 family)